MENSFFIVIAAILVAALLLPSLLRTRSANRAILCHHDADRYVTMLSDDYAKIKARIRLERDIDALERIWVVDIDDFYMKYVDFVDSRLVSDKCSELEDEVMVRKAFLK